MAAGTALLVSDRWTQAALGPSWCAGQVGKHRIKDQRQS